MVAEEHDRKLTESYHEEMNRAFIPVRRANLESNTRVLTWTTGWPVLYHDFDIHQGYQLPAPTRPEREGHSSGL